MVTVTFVIFLLLNSFPANSFSIQTTPTKRTHGFNHLRHGMKHLKSDNDDDSTNVHEFGHVSNTRRSIFLSGIPIALTSVVGVTTIAPSSVFASYTDSKTGISLPSEGEIENAIPPQWLAEDNPFTSMDFKTSFGRLDSKPDSIFYTDPRFVEHVDDNAVQTMTSYISSPSTSLFKKGDRVLDLCSSWNSHIDPNIANQLELDVVGLGMNEKELKSNKLLKNWNVVDLNAGPRTKLPYDDKVFDVVLCQLSIDYLIYPLDVMKEVGRVLKSGGDVVILISNRLFLQKAVGLWTGSDDIDHVYTVGAYLQFCDGEFTNIKSRDLSIRKGKGKNRVIVGDPLYAVTAKKKGSSI